MNLKQKPILLLVFVAVVFFVGLIMIGSSIPQQAAPASVFIATPAVAISTVEREQARSLYAVQCAGCHGQQGEGMLLIHPALQTVRVRETLTSEAVEEIIRKGAGIATLMPAYEQVLTDEDIASLTLWLRAGMP